jgi:hypothetical protein
MKGGAITLTADRMDELLQAHIRATLPLEVLQELAKPLIASRCQEVTVDQACELLRCKNLRQLQDKCRAMRIPIYKDRGQKSQYLKLGEIETGQRKYSELAAADDGASGGTKIVKMQAHQS